MVDPLVPALYHTHHLRSSEDLPFYLELAARQGGPILELGCGTGRVLEPLSAAGNQVFGLDIDFSMLDYLRRRMMQTGAQPLPVFQADMCSFCLRESFPLILLPCNTYSALAPEIRQGTLEQVRRHLSPAGIFTVSLPNPSILSELEEEAEAEIEDEFSLSSGEAVQVSSSWKREENRAEIIWQYDLLQPDGRIERISMQAIQYIHPPEVYRKEFTQCGLSVQSVYGDFDFSPYDEESPNLIFLLSL